MTAEEGHPAGVLIRALEPVAGVEIMRARRGREELTNGPGRLTQALAIGPELQRHPLDRAPLWIEAGRRVAEDAIVIARRIGIRKGAEEPLRYYDGRSRWVSRR